MTFEQWSMFYAGVGVAGTLIIGAIIYAYLLYKPELLKNIYPNKEAKYSLNLNFLLFFLAEVFRQHSNTITAIGNLKDTNSSLASELEELRQEKIEVTSQLSSTQFQLNISKEELKQIKQHLESTKNQVAPLQARVHQLEQQNSGLSSRLTNQEELNKQISKKYIDLEAINQKLDKRNRELDTKVSRLEAEKTALIEELGGTISDKNIDHENWKFVILTVQFLIKERKQLTEKVELLAERLKLLEAEKSELYILKSSIDGLERKLKQKNSDIKDLQFQNEQDKETIRSLTQASATIKNCLQEKDGLEQQCRELKKREESLNKDLILKTKLSEQKLAENEVLKQKLKDLKPTNLDRLEELEKENQKLHQENQKLRQKLAETAREKPIEDKSTESDSPEFFRELARLKKLNNELRRENRLLGWENEKLKEPLYKINTINSYKFTRHFGSPIYADNHKAAECCRRRTLRFEKDYLVEEAFDEYSFAPPAQEF